MEQYGPGRRLADLSWGGATMKRHLDETGSALLAAAHQLLAVAGPEALTVRRIATEAGMSTMNVYSRFGGKDGVIDELYFDGHTRLAAAIDAVPVGGDAAAELIQVARAYREFALANPAYYGIMFQSTINGFAPSQESTELALSVLRGFIDRVRLSVERGEIEGPEGSDHTEIALWLWATCHGMVSLELDGVAIELVDWPSVFDTAMRSTLATLRPVAVGAKSRDDR
jgi:AcrR family transcriptional regulator